MKQLFDFIPGIFFLVALFTYDIYTATAVIMISMTAQVLLLKIFKHPVSAIQWLSLAVIVGFGTATLLLHDPDFIKWKPTIINWVFAVVLLSGPKFFKRNFIQSMMGEQIDLPADVWKKLNIAWSIFLTLVGFLNIWVAQNFSEKTWALFKVFGIIGLMIVFIVAQGVYMSRFIKEQPEDQA